MLLRAIRTPPMNRYIIAFRMKSPGQSDGSFIFQINIKNRVAAIAIKVAMLPHIRTKPRRPSLQGNLAHHPAFHKGSQAIINRGHRNLRHLLLRPNEDFLCSRVIPLFQQHIINLLALRRKTKPARRQTLVQRAVYFSLCNRGH